MRINCHEAYVHLHLTTVTVTLEVEPKLEYGIVELASKAMFVRVFPITIDNLEGNVFIGWTGNKSQQSKVGVILAGYKGVTWCIVHVNQIRVENVELVALNNFRRRVVEIIMRLVIFVPHKTCVHAIEEPRLSRTILV